MRPARVWIEFRLRLSSGWMTIPGEFTRAEALEKILEARNHPTHAYRLKSHGV